MSSQIVGCAARPEGRATVEKPVQAEAQGAAGTYGETSRVHVGFVFVGPALATTITNNTDQSLTFNYTIQVLTYDGTDAITPFLGTGVTVPAGGTSSSLINTLPPIANGYYRVMSTALANPASGEEMGAAQLFINVSSGTVQEIDWAEWDAQTGDGPVQP